MPRLMASLRDGNVLWTASSKCFRKVLGMRSHILERLGLLPFFMSTRYPTCSLKSVCNGKHINKYPTYRIALNIPSYAQTGAKKFASPIQENTHAQTPLRGNRKVRVKTKRAIQNPRRAMPRSRPNAHGTLQAEGEICLETGSKASSTKAPASQLTSIIA